MPRRTIVLLGLALLAALFTFAGSSAAEDWPQWRGPRGDGVSTETNLPVKWSTTENVAWTVAMPDRSGSTPIIWGDNVFLNVAEGGELHLWVLDRKDVRSVGRSF